jgi:flavorubredoxin
VLQQFIPKNAMDEKLRKVTPYEKEMFEKMMKKAKKYVKNAMMRGV